MVVIIYIKSLFFEIRVCLSGSVLDKSRGKRARWARSISNRCFKLKNIVALSPNLGHGLSLAFSLLQEYSFKFNREHLSGARFQHFFLNHWLLLNQFNPINSSSNSNFILYAALHEHLSCWVRTTLEYWRGILHLYSIKVWPGRNE